MVKNKCRGMRQKLAGYWLVLAGACLRAAGTQAQPATVEMSVRLLNSETIAEVNLDQEEFLSYEKAFDDGLRQALAPLSTPADVYVQQTLHQTGPVSIEVFARPALSETQRQQLQAALLAIRAPHTRLVDFGMLFQARLNGGVADAKAAFTPEFLMPEARQDAAQRRLDLRGQAQQISAWARTEAIPVLATFENKVDSRFAGVRAVGSLLSTTNLAQPQDVAALTDRNSSYWRACLEMSQGNQLIPVSKAMMYAAQGELDRAGLYLHLLEPVSDPKAVPTQLAKELMARLQIFEETLNAAIRQGVALHDQGKFAEAGVVYDQLLAAYPASAWGRYEKYYSQNAAYLSTHPGVESGLWATASAGVYAANPMYPMGVKASSGREGYLLVKRMELGGLFKEKAKLKTDYRQYADTALLLGEYGLAAQLNWIIFSDFPKDDQGPENRLAYFLYCLDKLGNKDIAKNFKGNFPKEFARLETQLDRDMKQSATYRAFKN